MPSMYLTYLDFPTPLSPIIKIFNVVRMFSLIVMWLVDYVGFLVYAKLPLQQNQIRSLLEGDEIE